MKELEISYVSENPGPEYAKALDKAKTISELIAALQYFGRVAADAIERAGRLTTNEFSEWRRGLAQERKGTFAGEEFSRNYGDILIPAKLVISTLLEQEYKVPWGTAFLRCEEEGWPMLKDSADKKSHA